MNFDRPIIILAAPRSGSTLLFETLMATKNLYSIGGESHAVIEHIPELSTVANGYISNTLTKNHATSDVTFLLKQRFSMGLRDREGRPPNKQQAVRFLEKTPKNALRVEFLNHVFPDALFIHLVRDPLPNISSIIEAWQSGRFRTYPQLPGFNGEWSLLLPDNWQTMVGSPVEKIASFQWHACNHSITESLKNISENRKITINYADLLANPLEMVNRLLQFSGLVLDQHLEAKVTQPLATSRYTVSKPNEVKWHKHADDILQYAPQLQPLVNNVNEHLIASASSQINLDSNR
ncbi:sulfotransferase [Psychrosphaera sp. 1_MG-2023]|uniref:sulfotransferase family protein n=1 Tax=Psychrosphaera sp. 1_MG-2023 TaxID=3062643 RepID=UPI0026E47483|nr:sulfotransferase [Psychrosphaera sp. 1_MG-2023]MDO6719308.1 sulfotransferase [Psychrosphaera sp. 1_MG-2023]